MAEPSSTFAGVIVIDRLPHEARAAWPDEVAVTSELRQALLCLARQLPLDTFDEESFPPAQPTRARMRRQSTVRASARIDRLVAELNAEAAKLMQQIDRAKRS